MLQPLWKTIWWFLQKLKTEPPYDPVILLLGKYLKKKKRKERKTNSKRIHVPQPSKQDYLQLPRNRSNLRIHAHVNG